LFDSGSPATTGPHAALQKLTRKRPLPDAIAPEPLLPHRENPALEHLIGNMNLFLPEIREKAPAAMAGVQKKSNNRWRTYQTLRGGQSLFSEKNPGVCMPCGRPGIFFVAVKS
jgi:hypothetical protein